jgi:hypothetical protein
MSQPKLQTRKRKKDKPLKILASDGGNSQHESTRRKFRPIKVFKFPKSLTITKGQNDEAAEARHSPDKYFKTSTPYKKLQLDKSLSIPTRF